MNTVLTVAALNRYLASRMKEDNNLRDLMIKGEISNFTKHFKSGHLYFTLKDRESAIKAVMWNTASESLKFTPENGMSVIAVGAVNVYERDGVYQLYCNDIIPDGAGQIFIASEQLKEKLSNEGLFDDSRKKPLPAYPERIGVITAKGAAALADMITILKRRAPYVKITVYETAVQGQNAGINIAKQIKKADKAGEDLLIVGRGGGSFEDLLPFSDEAVIRAVAEAKTPLITAVGHETDTPLCDYASDLRAPTPSAAAELAVPDISTPEQILEDYRDTVYSIMSFKIDEARDRLYYTEKKLRGELFERFQSMQTAYKMKLITVDNLSPTKLLKRGYAVVEKDGMVITESINLSTDDEVRINFADGFKTARII
ncbi:MAG: exodeoxyribonuclease VII large subunit [Ruminococcus sp.]|jgi:exodeoxyribonuclease VII large subunit|nr:exodeoxyribonuclease VII large subunit [Ruminococcus sp.]